MAKLQVIKLTKKDVMFDAIDENGKSVKASVRKTELSVLEMLFLIAANSNTLLPKINICYDLVEQVKGVTEDQEDFKVAPSEVKEYLIPALAKSADQRSGSWYHARKMLKSIEKYEEIEIN